MPLTIRSSHRAENLFDACANALSADGRACIWFTHRIHRDLLLEHAAHAGISGWLNPPFAFFSELPRRFGIKAKPISLLDRRSLLNRIAGEHADEHGIRLPAAGASITRSSMLDSFFSELLPEGVTPAQLAEQLSQVAADDFAQRRNRWIGDVYTAYLSELKQRAQYDPRQVHALIAERIDRGELPGAINGAQELHIYGLYSTRARKRLLSALAQQQDVRAVLYAVGGAADDGAQPTIQPVPDAWREAEWIAGEVKKLIAQEAVEPHDIAIVARTGIEDTRRTLQVLRSAGIPATARVRAPLVEIGAIKAILVLFRAAAEDWSYPNLRRVLTSPYFKTRVDVRTIDRIAQEARPHSLARWAEELAKVIARDTAEAAAQEDEDRKAGLEHRIKRYRDTVPQLDALIPTLAQLDGERTLVEWIELTRELLVDGWLDFRRRICRPPMERNDVVRFDQRAVRQLEKMLQQWGSVADDDVLASDKWYALLRTLLAGQELALTTPGQKGVQILEAHDAALIPFRATFLLHANDGVFPRLPAAGGLFAEEEKAVLQAAGVPIDTFETAFQREIALWDAVTCGDRVTITYRTTDPKGTPLLPSLLVPAHDESRELARTADLVSQPLNAAQETYQDACALGVVARKGEEPRRIVTADTDAMRHLILQARAEQLRGAPDRSFLEQPLNPWNGVIRDPRVLDHLEREYGSEHWWSASQLETYAKCPFIYLIQRVLRVEEAEEADEETNALTSGGVAHDILELFYGNVKDQLPVDVATATNVFIQSARQVFHQRETSGEWLGVPVLWEQRKHWLCETLVNFIEWDIEELGNDRPQWCEYVLGGATQIAELNGEDTEGRPVSMLLRGRIDRVDLLARGGYRVVDYKTSFVPSKGHYCDGGALQGAIYIDALRQEGIDANCSVYKSLKKCQNGAPVTIRHNEYSTALAIAYSIPARVRGGLFEVNLAASQGKKWASWLPDASVTRNRAKLEKGASRFE